jgi:pimeloyl-ACP methyl ester carboxylesterase
MNSIERRFVATRSGTLHVAACGQGFPVLLLHQTPRSWDEYRAVLPLIGARHRGIAMDTAGFGDSPPLAGENSIERWAEVAFDLLDALGLAQAAVVGHHTGAAVALEMAASRPERVPALVLSACPFVDAARRSGHQGRKVIDEVERRPGGEHLTELWQRRMPFYPPGDIGLLERFMADALKAGDMAVEGHHVVNRYVMEERIGLVRCPTLVLAPSADPHVFPVAARVAGAIAGSQRLDIEGGMVPLPDQMPERFAQAVLQFLAAHAASFFTSGHRSSAAGR